MNFIISINLQKEGEQKQTKNEQCEIIHLFSAFQ